VDVAPVVVPRAFYDADPVEVGPLLLNKLLVRGDRVGRIVEVEAYRGSEDPASHAFRGSDPAQRHHVRPSRPPLRLFHLRDALVCQRRLRTPEGTGHAVLLRALSPVAGIPMRRARPPGTTDRNLTSGPAKLCQAFGITSAQDGADLVTGDRGLTLRHDGLPPPPHPAVSGRVGIRQAADRPWRWWVPDDPYVSPGRPRPA
jgi:DNA-3-methyladenine glycosylase